MNRLTISLSCVLLFGITPAVAQLQEVRQTIFGMD